MKKRPKNICGSWPWPAPSGFRSLLRFSLVWPLACGWIRGSGPFPGWRSSSWFLESSPDFSIIIVSPGIVRKTNKAGQSRFEGDGPIEERLLRRIEGMNAALLAVLPPAAWLLFSRQAALAVLVGGAIATLSFQFLKWQLRRALTRPGMLPTKGRLFVSYYLRFLGMLFVVFLVTAYGWTEPVPSWWDCRWSW